MYQMECISPIYNTISIFPLVDSLFSPSEAAASFRRKCTIVEEEEEASDEDFDTKTPAGKKMCLKKIGQIHMLLYTGLLYSDL